jgi:glutamyl-tRNA synthetase
MSHPTTPRVRIAPSPTGDPHVGTAYIGLFNLVLARKYSGSFILRIEDTDQTRSTPESERAILDYLKWVGLSWDEGPDVGGDYGPYRQSERVDLYREHAKILIARGNAYPCFCTSERLGQVRQEQRASGATFFGYDRHCRDLAPEDVAQRISAGEAHVVRMKMPLDGETVFEDGIRGTIRYENQQIDDQILVKSDGFPTYHLANVVDDHLMEITHVIRAEEWIPSTPKHIALYHAFGWTPPAFLHLSLLRNTDKSKISKRKNPVSLEWYKEAGFLPEALLNFLGLMGWSMPDEREQFNLQEMIDNFDTDRLKVSEPIFDLTKLEWLNGQWMRDLPEDVLYERLREFITGPKLKTILPLIQPRLPRLDAFTDIASYFYEMDTPFDPANLKIKRWPTKEEDGDDPKAPLRALNKALKELLAELESLASFDPDDLEERFRAFCERAGWKTKEIFMTARLIVCGRAASPPLFDTMTALGKARVQHRFRSATQEIQRAIK